MSGNIPGRVPKPTQCQDESCIRHASGNCNAKQDSQDMLWACDFPATDDGTGVCHTGLGCTPSGPASDRVQLTAQGLFLSSLVPNVRHLPAVACPAFPAWALPAALWPAQQGGRLQAHTPVLRFPSSGCPCPLSTLECVTLFSKWPSSSPLRASTTGTGQPQGLQDRKAS